MGILNLPDWNKPGGMLDFLFPPLCLGCGEYTESPDSVCANCLNRIDKYDYPLCLTCGVMLETGYNCGNCGNESFLLFSYGNYRDPLKEIIIHFKFKSITAPAKSVARELVSKFGDTIRSLKVAGLVPIPLYPGREYARGYNQAKLFAEQLSDQLELPVINDLLYRAVKRKPQASLRGFERAENIKGVFVATEENSEGQRVILVDDVVTSGATVREAKRTLEAAGYAVPAVISMAHGL
jgi:ComF family protein